MGALGVSYSEIQFGAFWSWAVFWASGKSCRICSSAGREGVPSPTVSALWEWVVFRVDFGRLFGNGLGAGSAEGSEVLRASRGRGFGVPWLLGVGRYFDRHPDLGSRAYGEWISSRGFGGFGAVFCPTCVLWRGVKFGGVFPSFFCFPRLFAI